MKKMKVLIVGGGVAGAGLHYSAYAGNASAEVVGFCDTDLAKFTKTHPKNGLPLFSDLFTTLQQNQIDIVDICTPPKTHFHLAKIALDHKCSVLVEKPLTFDFSETEEIVAYAGAKGGKLAVVHQNKFLPGIMRMKEIVDAGIPGRILQLDMSWLSNGLNDRMSSDPNFWCHALLGGRFAETLPHQLYCAYQLVGEMKLRDVSVKKSHPSLPWMDVDEVNAVFECSYGFVNIRLSTGLEPKKRVLSLLHGSKRSFLFNYFNIFPMGVGRDLLRYCGDIIKNKMDNALNRKIPPHHHVINRFIKYAQGKGPSPTPMKEALHIMELTHQFGALFEEKTRKMPL